MRGSVLGVGIWGPGLCGWPASRPVLAGLADHEWREYAPPPPSILPATERRRTSPAVRLALHAAHEACVMSRLEPGSLRTIFGSANGDGTVMHAILESLTSGEGHVSPTQFHNSVHNAAAGYWTIGAGSRQPATAVGCHDSTAGMALLSAMTEVHVDKTPVLLCVYDLPLPEPLHAKRPVQHGVAAALVLAPPGQYRPGIAEVNVSFSPASSLGGEGRGERDTLAPSQGDQVSLPSALLALTRANPAARMLPLLALLARTQAGTVPFAALGGEVRAAVTTCLTAAKSLL
jgi:hypothetical protein